MRKQMALSISHLQEKAVQWRHHSTELSNSLCTLSQTKSPKKYFQGLEKLTKRRFIRLHRLTAEKLWKRKKRFLFEYFHSRRPPSLWLLFFNNLLIHHIVNFSPSLDLIKHHLLEHHAKFGLMLSHGLLAALFKSKEKVNGLLYWFSC